MTDTLFDATIEELAEHLEQWYKDKVAQSLGGNLNDHQYLIGIVKDCVQDTNELIQITRGILNQLKKAREKSDL